MNDFVGEEKWCRIYWVASSYDHNSDWINDFDRICFWYMETVLSYASLLLRKK